MTTKKKRASKKTLNALIPIAIGVAAVVFYVRRRDLRALLGRANATPGQSASAAPGYVVGGGYVTGGGYSTPVAPQVTTTTETPATPTVPDVPLNYTDPVSAEPVGEINIAPAKRIEKDTTFVVDPDPQPVDLIALAAQYGIDPLPEIPYDLTPGPTYNPVGAPGFGPPSHPGYGFYDDSGERTELPWQPAPSTPPAAAAIQVYSPPPPPNAAHQQASTMAQMMTNDPNKIVSHTFPKPSWTWGSGRPR